MTNLKSISLLLLSVILAMAFYVFTAGAAETKNVSVKGDYLPAHNFKLEIDGVIAGGFKSFSGLESEIEVIEYKDGDDPTIHKRAGKVKYKNIVLTRNLSSDYHDYLSKWRNQVIERERDYSKKAVLIITDQKGQEIARYNLLECWPCRWKTYADDQGYIVEEIEFVVEKVERA